MIKKIVFGAAAGALALAPLSAAKADGFYINPEFNSSWSSNTWGGSVMDGHIGWEKSGFYIQGGPSWINPSGGETEVGFSAKTGVSAPVADKIDVYGEVSYAKYKDIDAGYGLKLGGKVKF